MKSMKIRLKLLLIISFFVLLYAAYYWGIPAFFDIQNRVPEIQKIVQKEMGTTIKLENPNLKMGLTPAIWLNADYFSIEDKDSSPLSIVKPKLKIGLLPLLFGKIHLGYFSCDKVNTKLKIDKKFRLYIGNHLIIRNANPKISIEDSQMDIESYNIELKDEIQNNNILIKGEYFNLDKYNSSKYLKFGTNTRIKVNNRYSTINADVDIKLPLKKALNTNEIVFDGMITNFNLADISSLVRKMSKNEIKSLNGILNIQADTKVLNRKTNRITSQMVIQNLYIQTKDKQTSIHFKDKLKIKTVFDIAKNIFKINKLDIKSGKIDAAIQGKINKITAKKPILDLTLTVNPSRTESFIALLPAKNYKDIDINFIALKKYGYYGNVQGQVLIKGKSDKPDIIGKFVSTEGYVIKPLNIPKATVQLNFRGKKADMDIFVPTSKTEYIRVKGPISLYTDDLEELNVTSSSNVDLQTAESIANPLHEIFYFELGPLPVMKLQGSGNINLKINGTKEKPHLFGAFNFKNTKADFNGIDLDLKNSDGRIDFKDANINFYTYKAFLDSKSIKITGKCTTKGDLDFDAVANNQSLNLLLNTIKTSDALKTMQKSIPDIKKADGKINLTLKLKGKVKCFNDFSLGKNVMASGNIKLLGNNVLFSGLELPANHLFGNIKFKSSDADFDLYSIIDKSKIFIKGKIRHNVLNLKMKLNDIAFNYKEIPVKIFSGNLEINDNKLVLYKVNAILDSMPVLVDGFATDIFKNPHFNIYMNSKPSQKFVDKYLNKNALYPLKIKGDIIYSARINGTRESFNTQAEIDLAEDSSIYYMGSAIGDTNNQIRIFLDTKVAKNSIHVNNFQYDKLISSQNNKEFVSPQLNAQGQITFSKKNISFQNFRVKTQNPTDAKIFNLLFKKTMIKQGLFNSNIIINNSITEPKLTGFLNFTGIDIPILDTTIKDISLNFNENDIEIKSKGEIFANKIILFANMKNRLSPPYELRDVDIYFGNLDINEIIKSFNKLDIDTDMHQIIESKQGFNVSNLIIKNAKLKADSILVKNIFAKDLTADFSLDEKMVFSLNNFKFNMAEGNVKGDFSYNLLNSRSILNINVYDANANSMADALFDLPNQVSGSLTGQVNLTCNGKTHKTCMNTLNGEGGFRISDGKMPKLGSLEYLLKAANLVKSGVTGLTINGIIELVTPLKTGQFETINGTFNINLGIANTIQIFSKGKDLSLFITGKYNFSTLIADMEVFGRVSKKISNALGPIGNTSLNTLFNTIPGLHLEDSNKAEFIKNLNKIPGFELSDKTYRIFSAEIYGDINKDNYVQSFKWIE